MDLTASQTGWLITRSVRSNALREAVKALPLDVTGTSTTASEFLSKAVIQWATNTEAFCTDSRAY